MCERSWTLPGRVRYARRRPHRRAPTDHPGHWPGYLASLPQPWPNSRDRGPRRPETPGPASALSPAKHPPPRPSSPRGRESALARYQRRNSRNSRHRRCDPGGNSRIPAGSTKGKRAALLAAVENRILCGHSASKSMLQSCQRPSRLSALAGQAGLTKSLLSAFSPSARGVVMSRLPVATEVPFMKKWGSSPWKRSGLFRSIGRGNHSPSGRPHPGSAGCLCPSRPLQRYPRQPCSQAASSAAARSGRDRKTCIRLQSENSRR